jgi:hydroxymethylglutaryl-CoA lyase
MEKVKIVEVGLRDGLQNETTNLTLNQRFELLSKLIEAGIKNFEIGAFVSADWVPQMAITGQFVAKYLKSSINKNEFSASVLVPNEKGMIQAIESGIKEVAIFAACSETFSRKNTNCTIDESFERFEAVLKIAKKNKIKVRGYLSTCFGCPFEGIISESKVVELAKRMNKLGVYEISIGDTIGIGHAGQVQSLFKKLLKVIPAKKLAGHFHDTRGQALVNIFAAYQLGIRTFDSSIAGLGGCPYAPGATGNVATEDVVFLFQGMGVSTGLDLNKLVKVHQWLQPKMDHRLSSSVGRVGLGKLKISKI